MGLEELKEVIWEIYPDKKQFFIILFLNINNKEKLND